METQEEEWLTALSRTLQEGDEVLINERSRPLTVTDRETREGVGTSYPHKFIWLEGNGTEYILKVFNTPNNPRLYSASGWFWRTYDEDHIEDEIEFKTGNSEIVHQIETPDERVIVSDLAADEFIESTVPQTEWAEPFTPTQESPTGTVLGECPDCGSDVVEDDRKASCTECELWCPVDEWRAFNE